MPVTSVDPASFVDLERYPLLAPGDPGLAATIASHGAELRDHGVAILPGLVRPAAVDAMVAEAAALAVGAHHQDVRGTPYLAAPDPSFPDSHPRNWRGRSALTAIPYDRFPPDSPLRALYEWDPLMDVVARILDRHPLHRYADPLGALNVAAMHEGDELSWHFDQTDFVVSIGLQSSDRGGEFLNAEHLRRADDERYDDVAAVLAGRAPGRVTSVAMTPGTLMLFAGRHSLHAVSPIGGSTPRYVALLGYDTRPDTMSSEQLRMVRYGRAS